MHAKPSAKQLFLSYYNLLIEWTIDNRGCLEVKLIISVLNRFSIQSDKPDRKKCQNLQHSETNEVFTCFVSFYLFPQKVFIKKREVVEFYLEFFWLIYHFVRLFEVGRIFCFIHVTSLCHSFFISNFFFFKTFSTQSLIPDLKSSRIIVIL